VSATVYSDDGGKTWKPGEVAVPNAGEFASPNECCVAELSDGRVMLNARSPSKANRRLVTISPDGATRWSRPAFDDALPEPICMGSLLAVPGDKPVLLFSNPDNLQKGGKDGAPGTGRDRKNVSIRLSENDGHTWTAKRAVEPGLSAYSDLTLAKDGTVLLLYERAGDKGQGYGKLTLARVPLAWVRDK
jgi:sialidase-1